MTQVDLKPASHSATSQTFKSQRNAPGMHSSKPTTSMANQPKNPLLKLPTEIIQQIAYLLPRDADITHFSSCCKSLAEKTVPAESSIWRQRFHDLYDTPPDRSSSELKVEYQIRAVVLAQPISFKLGETERQTLWLAVLKDMILESFGLAEEKKDGGCRTFRRIREVLKGSEFLNRPVSGHGLKDPGKPSEVFCAIQLSLTGLALDRDMSVQCLRTDYDIGCVYSYQPVDDESADQLFGIEPLNLESLMHIRNFWLRHLLNPAEATFHASYAKLDPGHRPAALTKKDSPVLETQWLGYYSCIHPYPESRSALDKRQSCADLDNHLTQVDCMNLILKPDDDPINWPPVFQEIIPLGEGTERLYFRGIQRYYNSDDQEINFVRGFMEPSQSPQGGFLAWQRVCFVIYEANREMLPLLEDEGPSNGEVDWLPNETWPPVDLEPDFVCIHGYEARLLPGGRVMMGQWVDMLDTTGRGPFIFWDV